LLICFAASVLSKYEYAEDCNRDYDCDYSAYDGPSVVGDNLRFRGIRRYWCWSD